MMAAIATAALTTAAETAATTATTSEGPFEEEEEVDLDIVEVLMEEQEGEERLLVVTTKTTPPSAVTPTTSIANTVATPTATPTTTSSSRSHNRIQDQRAKAVCQFRESLLPGVDIAMELKDILFSETSPYQQIDIVATTYGKTLVTDGKTQSAALDEYVYHESLVHPALLTVGQHLRTVFIGGGGELATVRETLKHIHVEKIIMVDLDRTVIQACKQFLPEWGGEAVYTHPKLQLVIGDAYSYLMETTERFDAIIMDISDPIEAGPGNQLYTKEFYQHALTLLNQPHGVFVTQAGMAESVPSATFLQMIDPSCNAPIFNTLQSVFDSVQMYSTNIPSFGSDWGFVMARTISSNNNIDMIHPSTLLPQRNDTHKDDSVIASTSHIDDLIERYIQGGHHSLQHYDGVTHQRMFHLPKPLRKHLEQDKRIITRDNPIYMY